MVRRRSRDLVGNVVRRALRSGAVADCLRRTNVQRPKDLVKAVADTGRNIDPLNDKKLKGKLGGELDVVALNAKIVKR